MDVSQLDGYLLAGSLVVVTAILAVRLTVRVGFPSLLIYLLMGVLLGQDGPVGIQFDDAQLAHALGFAALMVILAEGGLTTNWREVRRSMPAGVVLATVGIGISVLVVATGAHYLLGLDWQLAILLGAVTSPTDAAAVFSTLRKVPLPRRLAGTLEAESGLNDAPTVLLVTLLSTGGLAEGGMGGFALTVGYQLLVGALTGLVLGVAGAFVLRHAALPASGLYPLAVVTITVLAYAGAAGLHQSGFAAVYVAALVLGNSDLPHRTATRSFVEGFGWIAQIGLFVMLGMLAWPSRLSWETVVVALLAGLILTLLARPISVGLSLLPFRVPLRQQAFLSWAGLRGAVPIVLATIPLSEGTPGAVALFDIVFVLVVIYTVLQGPTLPFAAKVLRVASTEEVRDLDLEVAPLEGVAADLVQFRILDRSRMHGVEVGELRLPEGASIALVVRRGRSFVPDPSTVLKRGDEVVTVAPRQARVATESRLRAISRAGRLAHWRGEHGEAGDGGEDPKGRGRRPTRSG